MKNNVRISAIVGAVMLLFAHNASADIISRPSVKTPTTFAIIIDQESYDQAASEVMAYRDAVEADGLGVYIIVDTWHNPQPIRDMLQELHGQSKSPLEGCVLIGDIPIPMVRDAHHLTSAFKMSPKYDWKRSSVPSDRYYDDFGLKFDYLKQDSIVPAYHYMSLRGDGNQYISPDIYSARIRPLNVDGMNKYDQLRSYLRKATAEKQEKNALDHLTMARGHGYNSEDPVAWAGEQIALREQVPQAFAVGGEVKFYDFGMRDYVKSDYLNEVAREALDVMLFHHHGATDMQYLSGTPATSGINQSIDNIKQFLRGKVSSKAAKVGREAAVADYMQRYDVPESWCLEAFDSVKLAQDSVVNVGMDIYTDDIRRAKPSARFVLLDACYNGSFHVDDYVAGAYIFSDGKTIAAMGCTVNTVQDKWPDEFLGLLAQGMRIGQFTRFTCFLENHLIGDPTMHFSSDKASEVNQAIVLREGDVKFWKKQLKEGEPDMQAMALRQLEMANADGMAQLLGDVYRQSPYFVVRLEALLLLARNHPSEASETIALALHDSYELTRRFASEYAELNSDPSLIEPLAQLFVWRNHESRMRFRLSSAVNAYDHEALSDAVKSVAAQHRLYDTQYVDKVLSNIEDQASTLADMIDAITPAEGKSSKSLANGVSRFRNKPVSKAIAPLCALVEDTGQDKDVRKAAAEALGWYNMYHDRQSIANRLSDIKIDDAGVQSEVLKTIARLTGKSR